MSDEPPPLRLKPRPPSAEGSPSAPQPPTAPPPPPGAGADQGDATSRLRLKPRLNLANEESKQAVRDTADTPLVPPPLPPSAGLPIAVPDTAASPEPSEVPKFKLRPKATAAPPRESVGAPPSPPPLRSAPPPPPPPAGPPAEGGSKSPLPPPAHSPQSMPPMSILAAPPPPPPGALPEPPAPPGSIPRLSLSTAQDKPAPKAPLVAAVEGLQKVGGKPVVAKPGKTASVLRKRPALGPVAKAGLAVVVIAIAVSGFYSYRIFFPAPTPVMKLKLPIPKPVAPPVLKQPGPDGKGQGAQQANVGASGQEEVTPTPSPSSGSNVIESVMGESNISKDVKVSSTPIDAEKDASAAFRSFVANANIGGVYQGVPSKALINGTIVREGQVLDSALGIAFERVDPERKVIYFKDYTGAVVSKSY